MLNDPPGVTKGWVVKFMKRWVPPNDDNTPDCTEYSSRSSLTRLKIASAAHSSCTPWMTTLWQAQRVSVLEHHVRQRFEELCMKSRIKNMSHDTTAVYLLTTNRECGGSG